MRGVFQVNTCLVSACSPDLFKELYWDFIEHISIGDSYSPQVLVVYLLVLNLTIAAEEVQEGATGRIFIENAKATEVSKSTYISTYKRLDLLGVSRYMSGSSILLGLCNLLSFALSLACSHQLNRIFDSYWSNLSESAILTFWKLLENVNKCLTITHIKVQLSPILKIFGVCNKNSKSF